MYHLNYHNLNVILFQNKETAIVYLKYKNKLKTEGKGHAETCFNRKGTRCGGRGGVWGMCGGWVGGWSPLQ